MNNGEYELSDVPGLLQDWRRRGNPASLLGARAGLLNTCESIMANAEASSRAFTPDERRAFDFHTEQIRSINSELAEYKRAKIADLAARGIDASECRCPW